MVDLHVTLEVLGKSKILPATYEILISMSVIQSPLRYSLLLTKLDGT